MRWKQDMQGLRRQRPYAGRQVPVLQRDQALPVLPRHRQGVAGQPGPAPTARRPVGRGHDPAPGGTGAGAVVRAGRGAARVRVCSRARIGYSSSRAPRPAGSASGPLWRACGRGSVGRASPCQGEGRGFESRRPLGGAGFRPAGPRSARFFGCPRPWVPFHRENVGAGGVAEWLRQGPAKPCTRVRFPPPPRGRLAQWESASLTPKRSLVQSQYRPPVCAGQRPVPEDGDRLS